MLRSAYCLIASVALVAAVTTARAEDPDVFHGTMKATYTDKMPAAAVAVDQIVKASRTVCTDYANPVVIDKVNDQCAGADPDANVRLQLRRLYYPNKANGGGAQ